MNKTESKKFNISLALIVRFILFAECAISISITICIMGSNEYFILLFHLIVIIIDGIYVCFKFNGREYKWFSISKFAFIIVMVEILTYAFDQFIYQR